MKKSEFAEDILVYLHLEYGEVPSDLNALKLSELKFLGQFLLEGLPTYFWWYPSGVEQCWATVEFSDEAYNIGMTTISPDKLQKINSELE